MRSWAVFVYVVWICCGLSVAETVASMPAPTAYIDDYAGVLSPGGRQQAEAMCTRLHLLTKAQVIVVTVKTLEGVSVDQFANKLFHQWKIGESKTDRGVLLLFAIDDHKRRIEVGYGLEGILNDAKVGDIGREMVPALRAEHYDEAINLGVRDVAEAIAADAGVSLDADVAPRVTRASNSALAIVLAVVLIGGSLVFLVWFFIRAVRRNRRLTRGESPTLFSPATDTDPAVAAPIDWGRSYGAGAAASDDSLSSHSNDTADTSSSFDTGSNFDTSSSDTSSSDTSSSDFSGGGGGDSGGGGASGDW
ncbi:uncharacterized protein SAMN05421770_102518 [Granulicella rosea]|uniref:TPM domain-containing protein n=2 Tax=Granulicella rosea TaxID=474952 RepID=A0A239HRR9_9BACT|nr:uncharacterized protein SAMN05421770_102518 [Granulicella rosea]